uniref:Sphingomyelin phosphodiesterase C-terminal domain-containing protein n=1 Tax=Timema douglasi TaxID=61478 RepID=A0A7R8VN07_TIMDO|nr:unnamed protein product [Timema douglasi]
MSVKVLDYVQYYLDLMAANQRDQAEWQPEYNLSSYYGLNEVSPASLNSLAESFITLEGRPLFDRRRVCNGNLTTPLDHNITTDTNKVQREPIYSLGPPYPNRHKQSATGTYLLPWTTISQLTSTKCNGNLSTPLYHNIPTDTNKVQREPIYSLGPQYPNRHQQSATGTYLLPCTTISQPRPTKCNGNLSTPLDHNYPNRHQQSATGTYLLPCTTISQPTPTKCNGNLPTPLDHHIPTDTNKVQREPIYSLGPPYPNRHQQSAMGTYLLPWTTISQPTPTKCNGNLSTPLDHNIPTDTNKVQREPIYSLVPQYPNRHQQSATGTYILPCTTISQLTPTKCNVNLYTPLDHNIPTDTNKLANVLVVLNSTAEDGEIEVRILVRYYRANSVRLHHNSDPRACDSSCAYNHYCAITQLDYTDFRGCLETEPSAFSSRATLQSDSSASTILLCAFTTIGTVSVFHIS